jgi:hypothetical protein
MLNLQAMECGTNLLLIDEGEKKDDCHSFLRVFKPLACTPTCQIHITYESLFSRHMCHEFHD